MSDSTDSDVTDSAITDGEEVDGEKIEEMKEAWDRTVGDMEAQATAHEKREWKAVSVPADHTITEGLNDGPADRFGLIHVVPDNLAEDVSEALDTGTFSQYNVFRAVENGHVYLVIELLDHDAQEALLTAGSYEHAGAEPLINASKNAGSTYTYYQKHDETILGSFEHEEHEKFFPDIAAEEE
jgi:hypothetical protein